MHSKLDQLIEETKGLYAEHFGGEEMPDNFALFLLSDLFYKKLMVEKNSFLVPVTDERIRGFILDLAQKAHEIYVENDTDIAQANRFIPNRGQVLALAGHANALHDDVKQKWDRHLSFLKDENLPKNVRKAEAQRLDRENNEYLAFCHESLKSQLDHAVMQRYRAEYINFVINGVGEYNTGHESALKDSHDLTLKAPNDPGKSNIGALRPILQRALERHRQIRSEDDAYEIALGNDVSDMGYFFEHCVLPEMFEAFRPFYLAKQHIGLEQSADADPSITHNCHALYTEGMAEKMKDAICMLVPDIDKEQVWVENGAREVFVHVPDDRVDDIVAAYDRFFDAIKQTGFAAAHSKLEAVQERHEATNSKTARVAVELGKAAEAAQAAQVERALRSQAAAEETAAFEAEVQPLRDILATIKPVLDMQHYLASSRDGTKYLSSAGETIVGFTPEEALTKEHLLAVLKKLSEGKGQVKAPLKADEKLKETGFSEQIVVDSNAKYAAEENFAALRTPYDAAKEALDNKDKEAAQAQIEELGEYIELLGLDNVTAHIVAGEHQGPLQPIESPARAAGT